jgi:D-aminoacyl-tRNA deacylase
MKAVVTRVTHAKVTIDEKINGEIGQGFLVLLGIGPEDTEDDAVWLADKVCGCRVFADEAGKMNRNLAAVGGSLLVVSQFTLYADLRSRRPGFTGAAKPDLAIPLYERFMAACRELGFPVEHGEFGADMQVESCNDGPITLLFDTQELRRKK